MQVQEAELELTADILGPVLPRPPGSFAEFYYRPSKDEVRSKDAGRPIFVDSEYVKIQQVGDRTNILDRPATARDKRLFAREYAHFKNSNEQKADGTPLAEWPILSRSQVEELKYFGVTTVEQLAEVTDVNAQKFVGINLLRTKAKAYLDAAAGNAPLEKMQAELEERDSKIAIQQQTINDLIERIEKLEDK